MLACTAVAAAFAAAPAGSAVHFPDGRRPPVLDTFEIPGGLQALAVSPDGRLAAVAVLVETKGRFPASLVQVHDVDRPGPVSVSLPGLVRDLLFLDRDAGLYAIEHRPAKRGEGDSYLVTFDLEAGRSRRELRLPPSAHSLDYWATRRSLLVAARDELRTFTLPLLRSGPLFRVTGENLSVAVAGGTQVLVGQEDALLLVDLSDAQDREGLPVRERVDSRVPVVSVALAADGSSGVARLADDRVVAVGLDPLALAEIGTGIVLERPAQVLPAEPPSEPPRSVETMAPAPDLEPEPAAEIAGLVHDASAPSVQPQESQAPRQEPPAPPQESPAPPQDPPAPAPPPSTAAPTSPLPRPPPPEVEEARATPAEIPVAVPDASQREHAAPPVESAVSPEPMDTDDPPEAIGPSDAETASPTDAGNARDLNSDGLVRGRINGPAAAQVKDVVLFGPDNLLREAGRARPDAEGRFEVSGLAPGRYRVQLDGGGNRVLITAPRFRTVEISVGTVAVADFRVLRAL
jgi:hypothetical protein